MKIPIEIACQIHSKIRAIYHSVYTIDELSRRFNYPVNNKLLFDIYEGNYELHLPKFSYYRAPITNLIPYRQIDIMQLYEVIKGDYFAKTTADYRNNPNSHLKKNSFDFFTVSGVFSERKSHALRWRSSYIVLDFDHVPDPEQVKQTLARDEMLDPQLMFTSPGGDGLKAILSDTDAKYNPDTAVTDHNELYQLVTLYIEEEHPDFYNYLDVATSDIARACWLCHDPNCFINPKLFSLWRNQKNYEKK